LSRKRLLVVEDGAVVQELLDDVLTAEGFSVAAAGDGRQALAVLAAAPPDVILLDILLPVLDGREFLEVLVRHPEWTMPVVVLTAVKDLEMAEPLWERVCRVLTKPVDAEVIVDALLQAARAGRNEGAGTP
jgi:CheY-like chemotaxis protein